MPNCLYLIVKKAKFRAVIYLISFTVLVTLSIQVYRNIQNYELNRERLVTDVQLALDNGVEAYYADIARNNMIQFTTYERNGRDSLAPILQGSGTWQNVVEVPDNVTHLLGTVDSLRPGSVIVNRNSVFRISDSIRRLPLSGISDFQMFRGEAGDSLNDLQRFTNQILFSLTLDTLDFDLMQEYVGAELERKQLNMPYDLVLYRGDTIAGSLKKKDPAEYALTTFTKSTFLPRGQKLEMRFDNASLIILKRGMTDLLISLLISVTVLGALLFLYRIISRQKQLAEVKNDLINNITHEFKTPIATIAIAIDGIMNFNHEKDEQKTNKYLDISNDQLGKLNHMVEKLLETATLDSDKLLLTLEEVDVKEMLDGLREKYQFMAHDKQVVFRTDISTKILQADLFHLENAISNLIDNAVKYGGQNIEISLTEKSGKIKIKVADDGNNIEKSQKERIFEKFYRIPTGNRHDVKGFGIGLYYTKKIIEKHGGSILLNLDSNRTSFEVAI